MASALAWRCLLEYGLTHPHKQCMNQVALLHREVIVTTVASRSYVRVLSIRLVVKIGLIE